MTDERQTEIDQQELRERVVYALLEPAARLARAFGLPLNPLRDYAVMAYYHETRRHGLKMREVAELMDVSMSKVALMSRSLKENFLKDEAAASLPRTIEFMLWAEPLTLAKVKQVLTEAEADDVNEAIRALLEEGRITKETVDGNVYYSLVIARDRRVWDSWLARIDGLQNALRNVADAVFVRFFQPENPLAFARTLAFRARRDDLERLRAFYEELFRLVGELDDAAENAPEEDVVALSLSMFWAPHEHLGPKNQPTEEDS